MLHFEKIKVKVEIALSKELSVYAQVVCNHVTLYWYEHGGVGVLSEKSCMISRYV